MKNTDIIIFGGQSNMQGQCEMLSESNAVEGAFEYKLLSNELVPLANPVGETIRTDGGAGIPFSNSCTDLEAWLKEHVTGSACYGHTNLVPEFCRAYIKETQANVVAAHITKGSSVIAQWLPGTPGYDIIIKKASAAIEKASQSYNIGNIFFVWLQGESDAINGNSKEYYKEKLTLLCDSLKKDININKFGVIRVGRFTNDERDLEIISAQDEVCLENNDFLMLTDVAEKLNAIPEYMNPHVHGHYSAKGLETLGRLAGETLGKYASL